jgi:plasmid stabilization system protein ParE
MNYRLVIRKRAENHLKEAYHWYEKQRTALGDEFLLCVEATLRAIENNPMLFQVRYKNIRCALIPRFPYGLFYFIEGNKIVILSVFHLSRNPKLWQQ